MSHQDDIRIRRLITAHERRLQQLKEKQALDLNFAQRTKDSNVFNISQPT